MASDLGGLRMKYRLMRQDERGNTFLVKESKDGETVGALASLQAEYEMKGHKQTYWIEEVKVKPGIYGHFKGKLYEVTSVAKNKDDGTVIVVYRQLYDEFQLFWQKESEFTEWINKGDYQGPRFTLIKEF